MSNDIYMIINMIFLVYYVYKLMIIVCLTCNITLPRRQGSRPDGTRIGCSLSRGGVAQQRRLWCKILKS